MIVDQVGQAVDPGGMAVQGRDVAELAPARAQEGVAAFLADLFQGFQAIGHETGTHHVDLGNTLGGQRLQGGLGVGLEPARRAEPALEVVFEDSRAERRLLPPTELDSPSLPIALPFAVEFEAGEAAEDSAIP